MRRSLLVTASLLALAACGGPSFGSGTPTTKLDPPPGPFNDKITVTFTTDLAAKVFLTTDGTDPRDAKGTRVSGDSPFKLDLSESTTVTYYASNGNDELVHSVQYIRAGGKKGTISGVIVVDSVALAKPIALLADQNQTVFPALTAKGEIPFVIEGLATGRHRVQAIADRNGDGQFMPFLDLSSDPVSADIDLGDPFRASVENVRLFLGASDEGLCSIVGTVKVPKAQLGEVVRMSALNPAAFTQAAQDPMALLAQLQQGDQLLMQADQETYPYAITNLQPGSYIPVPALTSFALGGVGLHIIANPLQPVRCDPGKVVTRNFVFGPVAVSGTVTMATPATPPPGGGGLPIGNFAYGVVAAKHVSLGDGIQALLMPSVFLPDQVDPTKMKGNYTGHGLKTRTRYSARAFTSADPQNPLAAALAWVVNPFAPEPPHATLDVAQDDLTQDIDLVPHP